MGAEPSPCIKICSIEETTGFCLGCGRTLREVAQWTRLSDEQQRALKAELPQRLAFMREQGLTDDWKA